MGVPSSKPSNSSSEALVLCKERTQYIKQAIDTRYALSAAHLAYIQSLKSVGTGLRKFIESDVSIDPSISTSEQDRTPSRSSYASSSPIQINSPFNKSPSIPRFLNVSYMKASGNAALTVTLNPQSVNLIKEEESSSSWDFFDSNDQELVPIVEDSLKKSVKMEGVDQSIVDIIGMASGKLNKENGVIEREELLASREDASEFITHRAKDFLSSIKDIEYRFFKSSESGNEMSRLLETGKIRLNVQTEIIGKSPSCEFLSTFHGVCCIAKTILKHESTQNLAKIVTWNRSISPLSSSSKDLETIRTGGDNESRCDYIGEFYMISGSHSSTLDRLYAWERKLYDEVKTGESIRKTYDQKCSQLRKQFARNFNAQVIDKTRTIAKDLHSQIKVAIQAIDSISKKIEKIRDEELHPQLLELIQGLIRMWKSMLECHHTQFITISLAYHAMSSKQELKSEAFTQALSNLQIEIGCFASSFINLIKSHKSYIEALNSYIHKCILQSQEETKGRKKVALFPQRSLSLSLPPIFILCQYWLSGIKSLPSEELYDSIKGVVLILQDLASQQTKEKKDKDKVEEDEDEKFCRGLSLDCLKIGLASVFDRLAKFSEASLKVFEEVKQVNEIAFVEHCVEGK